MATTMTFDWQAALTLGIGLVALAYLVRRWWPSWRVLWQAPASCPTAGEGVRAPASSCAQGCGGCGSAVTPRRDHRTSPITVQRSEAS